MGQFFFEPGKNLIFVVMEGEKVVVGGIYWTNVIGGGDMWRRIKVMKYPMPSHYKFYGLDLNGSAIVDFVDRESSPFIVELNNIKKYHDEINKKGKTNE